MKLLRSQRNDVLRTLVSAQLDPNEFEWIEAKGGRDLDGAFPQLNHKPTDFFFMIDTSAGEYIMAYSPGANAEMHQAAVLAWDSVVANIRTWAASLKREIEAPDLWATLSQETDFAGLAEVQAAGENTPFSEAEQTQIQEGIEALRSYAIEAAAIEQAHHIEISGRLDTINQRLDESADASKRLGRKDWLLHAMGTVTSIVITAAFAPDQARGLLRVFANLFRWVVAGQRLLP